MSNGKVWLAFMLLPLVACAEQGKLKVEGRIAQTSAAQTVPGSTSLELGGGTLVVSNALVRVSEIEFEGGEEEEREAELGGAEIPLALDGGPTSVAANDVEAGSYHTVGLELRNGNSIAVDGSYDGVAFSFVSGLAPEVEFALRPEVVVPANGEATVGVTFDLAAWFTAADGSLLDPADPNNQQPIESNILASMAANAEIELADDD